MGEDDGQDGGQSGQDGRTFVPDADKAAFADIWRGTEREVRANGHKKCYMSFYEAAEVGQWLRCPLGDTPRKLSECAGRIGSLRHYAWTFAYAVRLYEKHQPDHRCMRISLRQRFLGYA